MTAKELYEELGGSYSEALTRLMNDSLIKKFLTKFADTYSLDVLLQAYAEKSNTKVFNAIHSLKGVVGNLALTSLYELTVKITELVRNKTDENPVNLDCELEDLKNKFSHTIEVIRKLD